MTRPSERRRPPLGVKWEGLNRERDRDEAREERIDHFLIIATLLFILGGTLMFAACVMAWLIG